MACVRMWISVLAGVCSAALNCAGKANPPGFDGDGGTATGSANGSSSSSGASSTSSSSGGVSSNGGSRSGAGSSGAGLGGGTGTGGIVCGAAGSCFPPNVCCAGGGTNGADVCADATMCMVNGDVYACTGAANCPGGVCCVATGGNYDLASCQSGASCANIGGRRTYQACLPGDSCATGTCRTGSAVAMPYCH